MVIADNFGLGKIPREKLKHIFVVDILVDDKVSILQQVFDQFWIFHGTFLARPVCLYACIFYWFSHKFSPEELQEYAGYFYK